jgi:hypothetical protein
VLDVPAFQIKGLFTRTVIFVSLSVAQCRATPSDEIRINPICVLPSVALRRTKF